MKCPKCGYNSFEFNDNCIKCSNDLTGYKETFGLKAIVLPLHARQSMAEILKSESEKAAAETVSAESSSDVFSFDLPESKPGLPGLNKDPFDFNDDDFTKKAGASLNDDFFGTPASKPAESQDLSSLLESTPQLKTSAAAAPATTEAPKGEFDLSDFSWDEPPAATPSGEPAKPTDDFSSLFGDSKGSKK
jgi:hypothetical protein